MAGEQALWAEWHFVTAKYGKFGSGCLEDFVTTAEQCDFDIDIYYDRYIVDAKSFLGIMSLDISRKLYVSFNGYNRNFDTILKKIRSQIILLLSGCQPFHMNKLLEI